MPIHIVAPGETLSGIAAVYGIPYTLLLQINGLTPQDFPVVGQALLILFPASVYTVRTGDTLASVAADAGISQARLRQLNPQTAARPLYTGETLVTAWQQEPEAVFSVGGYIYPYIDRTLLRQTLPFLTELTVFGYGFTRAGELIPPQDAQILADLKEQQVSPILLFSSLDENGRFSSELTAYMLRTPALQRTLAEKLLAVMTEKGYAGLDIDFEYVDPALADDFAAFIRYMRERLSPEGFSVHVDLAPKTSADQSGLLYEAHDYRRIGQIADAVFLMTYEWGYTYGPPMAVAPLNQVTRVLRYAISEIPREKISLGIPNYAYDWPLPYEQGVTMAVTVGNQQAIRIAAANRAEILFDETAAAPYFYYTGGDGTARVVWFEDVRSVLSKINLARDNALQRIGYWNFMRPFAQNTALLGALLQIRKNA
ncbi:MAG: LysM peptidoglycan-binding domain-containing protein [Clostridia bacterium]|nr:LysM peptidoglycan-binding domain-containing protein [Clostridia bacterium]